MIKYLTMKFACIGKMPMTFFKAGSTMVAGALCGLCAMCREDAMNGGVGLEIYYAPMLDHILTAFIIFWGGMFILDLAEKEKSAGK